MNTLGHIVAKDVRRMFLPAALWVALVTAGALWFRMAPVGVVDSWGGWVELMRIWSRLLGAVQGLFAVVLTGALVLEDPVVGDRAFWPTRPISGLRLLLAKVTAALLLFVAVPAAILLVVWLASGFGPGAAASAVAGFVSTHAFIILFATLVAALTANLGQFLLGAVVLFVLFVFAPLAVYLLAPENVAMAVRRSRMSVFHFAFGSVMLAVVAHQFLTRRTCRSWLLLGLGIVVLVGLTAAWRWDLSRIGNADTASPAAMATTDAGTVTAERLFGRIGAAMPTEAQRRHRVPTVEMQVRQEPSQLHLPLGGTGELAWRDNRRAGVTLAGARMIPDSAVRAAVDGTPWPAALTWPMRVRRTTEPEVVLSREPVAWSGIVDLGVFRRAFLLELPLRRDAVGQIGPNRVRVLAVNPPEGDRGGSIVVEERDAWRGWADGMDGGRVVLGLRKDVIDCFAVRLPASETAHVAHVQEVGAVNMASMVTGILQLSLPSTATMQDLEQAVLVKVRFELVEEVQRAVSSPALEVVPDKQP